MKFIRDTTVVLALTSVLAFGQTIPQNMFSHIIIVVQENRTPDNLFGAGSSIPVCGHEDAFMNGVDIQDGGFVQGQNPPECMPALPLSGLDANGVYVDPDHMWPAWAEDYDGGAMDGFCHSKIDGGCPMYSFVPKSDVQPYFDIATEYSFANYMFQTNEGGSFPAHQFLFTGTSAPVAPYNSNYIDFVAMDPTESTNSGCELGFVEAPPEGGAPAWARPDGTTLATNYWICYTHDSLVTSSNCNNGVCDKGVSWRYYAPNDQQVIWDAPSSIPEVCYGQNSVSESGNPCSGPEWDHMTFYTGNLQGAPIFNDINTCNLQQISWVIPDEAWSDHAAKWDKGLGPAWVADIVDAIGNSWTGSGSKCDYWGSTQHPSEPTAILIVWDDWGGWYDHVAPLSSMVYRSSSPYNCPDAAAPNGWGCGYVYGFRVPFMVVSEYTGVPAGVGYSGYVSGACMGNCPNLNPPFVHDFGSILAFTEYNFNLPFIDQAGDNGYADYNAPDWGPGRNYIPLADFFGLYPNGRPFASVNSPFPASGFYTYYTDNGISPTGPDGGDTD